MSDNKKTFKDNSPLKPFGETTTPIAKAFKPDIIKGLTITGIAKPVPPPSPPSSSSTGSGNAGKK
jgi:hypothetical protein